MCFLCGKIRTATDVSEPRVMRVVSTFDCARKLLNSSIAYKIPPKGVLKAADRPQVQPTITIVATFPCGKYFSVNNTLATPYSDEDTAAHMCRVGLSTPRGEPKLR